MFHLHRNGHQWVYANTIAKLLGNSGSDFAQLSHWGVIERRPKPGKINKHMKGWWRLTRLGREFAQGLSRLPLHADIYDGKLLQLDATETASIADVLGEDFDLDKLLSGIANIPAPCAADEMAS